MNRTATGTIALFGAIAILAVGVLFVTSLSSPTGDSSKWSRQFAITPQPMMQGMLCSDSDRGMDFTTKGMTVGVPVGMTLAYQNVQKNADFCTTICQGDPGSGMSPTGPCLVEFSCTATAYSTNTVIACPFGCVDGACVTE